MDGLMRIEPLSRLMWKSRTLMVEVIMMVLMLRVPPKLRSSFRVQIIGDERGLRLLVLMPATLVLPPLLLKGR